jgi:Tol biopolymer transport system component
MRSLLLLAAFGLLVSLAGCGGGGSSQVTQPPQAANVLAYLHRSNGLIYEIKVLKSDGTSVTVGSTDNYISVVLAPNGQKVLFSYWAPGYQVGTMNVDGTGRTVLTSGSAGALYPQYTPDGSRIVYQSSRQLAVMNADGTNSTVITNLSAGEFCFPATNGSVIAVGMFTLTSQGLATMNMDGSNQQVIVGTAYPVFPAFSADGTKIIFSNSDGRSQNIYSVGTNGSNLVNLTNSPWNWDPFVAGSKIYFDYIPNSIQNPTTDSNQIYSIALDGSNLTAVTNDTLYDGFKTFNGSCQNP